MARRTTPFDPYARFNFKLEIDGITVAGFTEVTGLNAEVATIDYREGHETLTTRKLPGLSKFGNITLKRGVTQELDIFKWIDQGMKGDVDRKQSISIVLNDEQHKEAARWNLLNVWPTKYMAPDLKADASEIAIETLEFVHEGVERKK